MRVNWTKVIEFLTVVVFASLFVGFVIGIWKLDKHFDERRCNAKTEHMGFNHSYDPWTGCLIEVEAGKWIPLDSYYYKEE